METDLHVVELGEGDPIVFVHGSFGWGDDTFPDQRELGDDYRVVLVDRRGYGDSPPAKRFDFDSLTEDICALLGDGVHTLSATLTAGFSAYSRQPAGQRRCGP
jgi:pimeloyl-ACP methyl ester carboxylesterase